MTQAHKVIIPKFTYGDVLELVSSYRDEAKREAQENYSFPISRGYVLTAERNGAKCEKLGDCDFTNKSELISYIQDALDSGGIESLCIEGGFDGADSPYDYRVGNYDPLVSEWAFTIWDAKQGFDISLGGTQDLNEDD